MTESPHDQLAHLMSGYWYTQTIYVAAKLRLADLLKDEPKTAEELAPGHWNERPLPLPAAAGPGERGHLRRG